MLITLVGKTRSRASSFELGVAGWRVMGRRLAQSVQVAVGMEPGASGFLDTFQSSVKDLEDRLDVSSWSVEDVDSDRVVAMAKLNAIQRRMEELELKLISAKIFLPVYEVRKCCEELARLGELERSRRLAAFPKQRFRFRKLDIAQALMTGNTGNKGTNETTEVSQTTESSPAPLPSAAISQAEDVVLRVERKERLQQELTNEAGKDVVLSGLRDCVIDIKGVGSTVYITDVENSSIRPDPVGGSIHLTRCANTKLIASCHQLRIHDCSNCDFYIHVASGPIIEGSSALRFAPIRDAELSGASNFAQLLEKAQLDPSRNQWQEVKDFNWLRVQPSPNWTILS